MKFLKTSDDAAPIQMKFSFPRINNKFLTILGLLVFAMLMIFIFPLWAQSEDLEPRIPLKATEHTATLIMTATNNASTSLETFTLDIDVDPGGQSINAVGIFIGFASSSVTALEINTDNSFCDFFIDTSINQEAGEISIFCGKPYPGVATTSNIAQITFRKDVLGLNNIEVKQNSLVLVNDGFGTNILKEINSLDILVN